MALDQRFSSRIFGLHGAAQDLEAARRGVAARSGACGGPFDIQLGQCRCPGNHSGSWWHAGIIRQEAHRTHQPVQHRGRADSLRLAVVDQPLRSTGRSSFEALAGPLKEIDEPSPARTKVARRQSGEKTGLKTRAGKVTRLRRSQMQKATGIVSCRTMDRGRQAAPG